MDRGSNSVDYKLVFAVLALIMCMALYWFWIFELVDYLLNKPKLSKLLRIPVGFFNAVFIISTSILLGGTTTPYILVMIILLIEFYLFYKDSYLKILFCALACILHVLAIRAITIGFISLSQTISIYGIIHDPLLYVYSLVATFIFINIAILLVIKILPLKEVRIVNNHKEQQLFMVFWMILNTGYLLFNSAVAENPVTAIGMVENQIVAPCVMLVGTYIMLNFAIKTGKMLGYKEKNEQLELEVSMEHEYRSSITKDALSTLEFNVSKNSILDAYRIEHLKKGNKNNSYSEVLCYIIKTFIHPDDRETFTQYASPTNIIREFEKGNSELTLEYRRINKSNEYIWCRVVMNLVRDNETHDIIGFAYTKDINQIKCEQLEMQFKAQRDPLTGLYNKAVTNKLISEHLIFNHCNAHSALFMIDIDNFKHINDHFGHAFGDKVLCDLANKLEHIFRPDDIIGRIGGDEYIAYLKSGACDTLIREKGDEICELFKNIYIDKDGNEFELSNSVGIAVSPKDGVTFVELYTHADAALYVAKRLGKNNCQIYDGATFGSYETKRK